MYIRRAKLLQYQGILYLWYVCTCRTMVHLSRHSYILVYEAIALQLLHYKCASVHKITRNQMPWVPMAFCQVQVTLFQTKMVESNVNAYSLTLEPQRVTQRASARPTRSTQTQANTGQANTANSSSERRLSTRVYFVYSKWMNHTNWYIQKCLSMTCSCYMVYLQLQNWYQVEYSNYHYDNAEVSM